MRKNVSTVWVPGSYSLSADAELDLVDIIRAGAGKDTSTDEYKDAREAVEVMVTSYAPFIEKLAWERMDTMGDYGFSHEDALGEAYLAAIQCAWSFDPSKSSTAIRFSSYASRAINSALSRMNAKTRTVVSTPITMLLQTRQWLHIYYDLVSKGVQPNDEEVSILCGVDMTFDEARQVVQSSAHEDISEAIDIGEYDRYMSSQPHRAEDIVSACHDTYGGDADRVIMVLGLENGKARISPFFLSNESRGKVTRKEAKEFFERKDELLSHPRYRVMMSRKLSE